MQLGEGPLKWETQASREKFTRVITIPLGGCARVPTFLLVRAVIISLFSFVSWILSGYRWTISNYQIQPIGPAFWFLQFPEPSYLKTVAKSTPLPPQKINSTSKLATGCNLLWLNIWTAKGDPGRGSWASFPGKFLKLMSSEISAFWGHVKCVIMSLFFD